MIIKLSIYLSIYLSICPRAVHLELVPDSSVPSLIRCFRRFSSRRGVPETLISDNAKTFKAASRNLSRLFDLPDAQTFLVNRRVSLTFNLERTPWWDGFFERMVKCTKRCVKKILGRVMLSYEELLTIVIEIEAILNSMPLSYLDAGQVGESLTPSQSLMRRKLSLPEPARDKDIGELNHITLNRRERHISNLLVIFLESIASWISFRTLLYLCFLLFSDGAGPKCRENCRDSCGVF